LISDAEHLLLPGTNVKGESQHIAVLKEKQQNIPMQVGSFMYMLT
jgi:hypothetical protein